MGEARAIRVLQRRGLWPVPGTRWLGHALLSVACMYEMAACGSTVDYSIGDPWEYEGQRIYRTVLTHKARSRIEALAQEDCRNTLCQPLSRSLDDALIEVSGG